MVKCNDKYLNVKFCKQEITCNYCQLSNHTSCLSEILNNKNAKCKKIKEENKAIEIIKDGAILVSGKHTVNNISLNGTYLITFENKTIIDNITFENPTAII